ncbi:HNH endonuclease [Paenibacillus alba]|uniref:HNH endonuclease n=1 Tax=Paenibacillus alba TaxID=1197127 RepID=UPI0030846132
MFFLSKHPLCLDCLKKNRVTAATVIDHIIPHKGNRILFWDQENWQPMCGSCHGIKTASEDGGFGNVSSNNSKKIPK